MLWKSLSIFIVAITQSSVGFNNNRQTGDLGEPSKNLVPNEINRLYLFFENADIDDSSAETTEVIITTANNSEESDDSSKRLDPDPLSVVWYLGAFSGLIIFFLVVTFSEWCCASKHLYRNSQAPPPYHHQGYNRAPATPPPPYHLFAPPPYTEAAEKREPIFIIPVHPSPSGTSA